MHRRPDRATCGSEISSTHDDGVRNPNDFLSRPEGARVEHRDPGKVSADVGRVYETLGNLVTHRTSDVLLFDVWHPRWEFVILPRYAAYLNLIGPCGMIQKALELKGRGFVTWEEGV